MRAPFYTTALIEVMGIRLTLYINGNSVIQALLLFFTIKEVLNTILSFFLQREAKRSLILSLELENYKKLHREKEKEELKKIASIG